MTTITTWLVHCVLIAAVLAMAAHAWEVSARWSGRSARWAWLAALAGSVTFPWLLQLVPTTVGFEAAPVAVAVDVAALGPAAEVPVAVAAAADPASLALLAWAFASTLGLAYLVGVVAALRRARRRWREAEVDGARVLVARDAGPAAFGLRTCRVVLPTWALELAAELRALLLLHEREHVRAGDPRLLFGSLLLLATMPWNPVVWYQVARLRNALELDCDARVLRHGVDPRQYGSLLLEVGRRRGARSLVMATFAEPRIFLEERIRRIARWPLDPRPGRAVGFAAAAVLLGAGALSAGDALRPVEYVAVELEAEAELPLAAELLDVLGLPAVGVARVPAALASDTPPPDVRERPTFTPMTRRPELRHTGAELQAILRAQYPPLLRDAGIGGEVLVWFFIDETGRVQRTQVARSSGHPALDEAALRAASQMAFTPALNRDERVAVWVQIPVVFRASDAEGDATTRAAAERARADAIAAQQAAMASIAAQQAALTRATRGQPVLRNLPEVLEALTRNYPPLLRDAGIRATVLPWLYVGTDGRVSRTMISRSSGYPALDEAALRVANIMRFEPHVVDGAAAEVWVELPISFGGAAVPAFERQEGVFRLPSLTVPLSGDEGVVRDAARGDTVFTRRRIETSPPPPPTRPTPPDQPPAAQPQPTRPTPPDQPPPPPPRDLLAGPTFTPMTQRPELQNAAEVQRLLIRHYPPMLRDAGIGGAPVLWFLVGEDGAVRSAQLSRTSGYAELDEAAIAVAKQMRFSPALNRDQRVPVWIEIPIVFTAR
jgi:TonB family protein